MDENRITRRQAADLLKVSDCTVANFVKRGAIPPPLKIGRRDWYLLADIEKVTKEGTPKRQA